MRSGDCALTLATEESTDRVGLHVLRWICQPRSCLGNHPAFQLTVFIQLIETFPVHRAVIRHKVVFWLQLSASTQRCSAWRVLVFLKTLPSPSPRQRAGCAISHLIAQTPLCVSALSGFAPMLIAEPQRTQRSTFKLGHYGRACRRLQSLSHTYSFC
jgi:hypothetical protein